MTARNPEPDSVAERAYSIWEEEGRPHGRDHAHWHRAERELTGNGKDASATLTEAPAGAPAAKAPRARKAAAPKAPAAEAAPGEAPKPARTRKSAAAAEGGAAAPKKTRAKTVAPSA